MVFLLDRVQCVVQTEQPTLSDLARQPVLTPSGRSPRLREIDPLLHTQLPMCRDTRDPFGRSIYRRARPSELPRRRCGISTDRKSTRLNSSHLGISYAVFCL